MEQGNIYILLLLFFLFLFWPTVISVSDSFPLAEYYAVRGFRYKRYKETSCLQ